MPDITIEYPDYNDCQDLVAIDFMIYKLGVWFNKDRDWILYNCDVMDFIEQSSWRQFDNFYEWKINKAYMKK
jgi:hypothetical protein